MGDAVLPQEIQIAFVEELGIANFDGVAEVTRKLGEEGLQGGGEFGAVFKNGSRDGAEFMTDLWFRRGLRS